MNRKRLPAATLTFLALTLVALLHRANADVSDEVNRLASLMDWKPGTIVADIGAGDGRYAFAAAQLVGASGKVFATEIDREKLASLRSEVAKRRLANVLIIESKEADT